MGLCLTITDVATVIFKINRLEERHFGKMFRTEKYTKCLGSPKMLCALNILRVKTFAKFGFIVSSHGILCYAHQQQGEYAFLSLQNMTAREERIFVL